MEFLLHSGLAPSGSDRAGPSNKWAREGQRKKWPAALSEGTEKQVKRFPLQVKSQR
jgi:hypothetical protein